VLQVFTGVFVLQVCCVTGVLQVCYRCVTGVLQVCYRCVTGVTGVLCVTGVLQVCCVLQVFQVFQVCYRCVTGVFRCSGLTLSGGGKQVSSSTVLRFCSGSGAVGGAGGGCRVKASLTTCPSDPSSLRQNHRAGTDPPPERQTGERETGERETGERQVRGRQVRDRQVRDRQVETGERQTVRDRQVRQTGERPTGERQVRGRQVDMDRCIQVGQVNRCIQVGQVDRCTLSPLRSISATHLVMSRGWGGRSLLSPPERGDADPPRAQTLFLGGGLMVLLQEELKPQKKTSTPLLTLQKNSSSSPSRWTVSSPVTRWLFLGGSMPEYIWNELTSHVSWGEARGGACCRGSSSGSPRR
ncbi:hypothetical protein F7725_008660, partial [Dissostichus mawsoni]